MQVVKVKEKLLIRIDSLYTKNFRSTIFGSTWNPSAKAYEVPASLATYINFITYKNLKHRGVTVPNIELSPEATAWYSRMGSVLKRQYELQDSVRDKESVRDVAFPPEFRFTLPPYQHQKEAIAFSLNLDKVALWLDLGLGKTYTSINIARYRHIMDLKSATGDIKPKVNKVLVVAPLSLLRQWGSEISKYAPDATYRIIDGTVTKKNKIINEISEYEGEKLLFAMCTYEGAPSLKNGLINAGFDMFILDESTKIKNPQAVRTKAMVEICKTIPYGVELTGLAYLNNPVDLYSQFLALDPCIFGENWFSFTERYVNWTKINFGGRVGRIVRSYKNLPDLKARAHVVSFARAKKDCLDLPEKIYTQRSLGMYDTQKEWYDMLAQEIKDIPQDQVSVVSVLTQLEKLQQVTSGFIIQEDRKILWFDSPKYKELADIVQDSTESFIVWARHTYTLDKCLEALKFRTVNAEILSRKTPKGRRDTIIKQFKEGALRVLICQITSESKGLDLTCKVNSVNSVYVENSMSIDERWQSESRQHRIGMTGTATYIDLVIEDTIDEGIVDLLRSKYKVSEYITNKGIDMLLGKGGSVVPRKTKSKKRMAEPQDFEKPLTKEDYRGLIGFEDLAT